MPRVRTSAARLRPGAAEWERRAATPASCSEGHLQQGARGRRRRASRSLAPSGEYLDASLELRTSSGRRSEERRTHEIELERRSVRRVRSARRGALGRGARGGDPHGRRDNRGAEAERQARVASARELAAAAVANVDNDQQLSVLLAIEAVERTRSVDGSVLREAEEALHRR